ncbi:MAG: hydantoinase/oxoprolinase family protein [Deltaproteobacteria bacterium]|nr:hydantoinase/oxoprolinase family protein [Deltaproteobacteria bacterium]MBW2117056.1 hydantoinase/oxoprolinase family protein [Deltaproteobacteria bacterium]
MGLTINVDIGGTFTDFFVSQDKGITHLAKSPTTHYDLSVGFMKGINELARLNGLGLADFLNNTDAVRYCTTLGTNALIERTGPKLGLITTAGFEDAIFLGRGRSWADGGTSKENKDLSRIQKPEPLISRDMVVGVRERIDSFGNVICPLNREEVLEKLQILVDRGAMGFVVCLLWSFMNPEHERMVKEIIEEEYPEDYLGSMPVTLSSDVSPKSAEYTRFITTIVNAYIHGVMSDELNKLGIELRDGGYKRPLILVHNTGGMKKVSRTRAILTHNAGPVAGLHGALTLGKVYGLDNIIFTDMGGTSFDIGVITGGRLRTYDFIPVIDRWRTNIPAIEVKSIGAGGGSIAWVNNLMDNALEVGPQSAGSMPGPACYDQGGQEATVTDADLVLGYINPDNYLGGKMLLDPDLSRQVIDKKIAEPLGIDAVKAAIRIRQIVDARMGQEVFNEVALKGHDPRDFVLFACGGAGATHACGFAPYLQVNRVIVSNYSPVFGAFGASTVNIQQVWEKSRTIKIFQWATQSYSEDTEIFNGVVNELKDLAIHDLRLEGFSEDQIQFRLELDMRYGMQYNLTKIVSPHSNAQMPQDFKDICDRFTEQYSAIYTPEATFPMGGINVECFYLTAYVELPDPKIEQSELKGHEPPGSARLVSRQAYWSSTGGFEDTPVFSFPALEPGNVIIGPALIEAEDTTYVIEPEWKFALDSYRNGVLERI